MRVLLSEGSGLTSRQVATRLGEMGHEVEILSSASLCLTRFTRHARRVHEVPSFGASPIAWFEEAKRISRERRVDLLFPTQEQVTVLSAFERDLGVPTIVPPFAAIRRVQDKVSAFETLRALGVPQPESVVARTLDDLPDSMRYPIFVKRPISTASSGVERVESFEALSAAVGAVGIDRHGLVLQSEAEGALAMVQVVADRGRVIAHHANLRVREGLSGGASTKESLPARETAAVAEKLTAGLGWHGAISFDVILTDRGPLVIDINPRLVEPANAWLSGVDLVGAMVSLAQHQHLDPQPPSTPGVRSHQLLIALLGAARGAHPRADVAREIAQAVTGQGPYAEGVEELTPVANDPLGAAPVVAAALATLAWPPSWRWFGAGAVASYSLTPSGWDEILRRHGEVTVSGRAERLHGGAPTP